MVRCARAGLLLLVLGTAGAAASVPVDNFEDSALWSAHPADGVELAIGSEAGVRGKALRLDFDFVAGSGYAVARREVSLDLPENYAFTFFLRGEAPPNHVELKLIDATGENVWWHVWRDATFPSTWEAWRVKKRQIRFAWGPLGGGEIRHVAAIELAITAGSGGRGTVWLDELELEPLPPPGAPLPPPVASASSARDGAPPAAVLDDDPSTAWTPEPADAEPWIAVDFGGARELGGAVLDWRTDGPAAGYLLEASEDGEAWHTLRTVERGNGGRDYLYLPETECRALRVRVLDGDSPALAAVRVQPLEWAASRETFFGAIARDARRGIYPRGMSGEQTYWTVVGVDGGERNALLSEDGALETGPRAFSIEPFLSVDGELLTWADVRAEQQLEEGFLPIPSVIWRSDRLELTTTAFATGAPGAESIVTRYRIRNVSPEKATPTLYLALRPFQVNPPSQFLNTPGGTAPIRDIAGDGRAVHVNGERAVVCLSPASGFGALSFDEGDVVADWLQEGRLPGNSRARDPFEAASGALAFPLEIPPGGERQVHLLVPLGRDASPPGEEEIHESVAEWVEERLARCRSEWLERTSRVVVELPETGADIVRTLRSQLAYILVNRAGPAIRPGTRAYARSWIRDGSLTSSALLRLGHPRPAKEFLDWYAPHQYPSGKVPCVVDARGPDPVPEHDSTGELLFLVAEIYRLTGDRELAQRMWPHVTAGVSYLESLRQERRTPDYHTPELAEFFGILPPSISHEGYSAKPMHSYWDDFWAYRGFSDAAFLAGELGHVNEGFLFAAIRDEFARDLTASVGTAMDRHGIDYVPGCADLGDFDATSTTIALSPTGAAALLPEEALERTFERYGEFFRDRRGGAAWDAFTPYEIRNVGAFVRLGWRERAQELLDWFLQQRRPAGWNQWPEVVRRDERAPAFLGDLPHTWVGSDYVRSVLDLLAYEREGPDALVLAAGVPREWLAPAGGVVVRELPTRFGRLSYTLRLEDGEMRARIEEGIAVPEGGILLAPPLDGRRPRAVTVNGAPVALDAQGRVPVRGVPAEIVLRF